MLRAPPGAPLEIRLSTLAAGLRTLLSEFMPASAAVEDVFVKADPKAALAVGHGRGALLAVLGEAKIPVTPYPPATVKLAVAGSGKAAKEQVARMVSVILGVSPLAGGRDATDALAIAITLALRSTRQHMMPQ